MLHPSGGRRGSRYEGLSPETPITTVAATLNVTATLDPEPEVSGKVAGCPNGNWKGINPVGPGITSATLVITQGGQTIFGPVDYINPNN